MKRFADLIADLESSTDSQEQVAMLVEYFGEVSPMDSLWAIFFLSGRSLPRFLSSADLKLAAREAAGIPEWMFQKSYDTVGNLTETLALIVVSEKSSCDSLTSWIEERLIPLREEGTRARVAAAAQCLLSAGIAERYAVVRLLAGRLKVSIDWETLVRSIAIHSGVVAEVIAFRLSESWMPSLAFYEELTESRAGDVKDMIPYAFSCSQVLDGAAERLGHARDFTAEWKRGGVRSQMVRRRGRTILWSDRLGVMRGWPELVAEGGKLPDGIVLEGEILPVDGDLILPVNRLGRRRDLSRKSAAQKLVDEVPARFFVTDVLESAGKDIRTRSWWERRAELNRILRSADTELIAPMETVDFQSWETLGELNCQARAMHASGLTLRRLDAPQNHEGLCGVFDWPTASLSATGVLVYAESQGGAGGSEYTFAFWDEGELVPCAKVKLGLSLAERSEVDEFVRLNTIEKFGPVRRVNPELVMEIEFDGVEPSPRRKCGISLLSTRIRRWLVGQDPAVADDMAQVQSNFRG